MAGIVVQWQGIDAQSSRAEEIAALQARKAEDLRPYEPPRAERLVAALVGGLLAEPTGLYPFIGSVYPGGGLALGPAVRLPYGDTGVMVAHAGWSTRNFKRAAATLTLPSLADGHVTIAANAQAIDAPTVAFYGIGPDSVPADRTRFLYRPLRGGVTASARTGVFTGGGGIDYLSIQTRAAGGETFDPSYGVGRLFAQIDWRESPGYTTRGGLYRVDWTAHRARAGLPHSFERVDVELNQFVPLIGANWVLAFRATASLTSPSAGHEVPYFLLPSLGSGTDARGYDSFRFRDRHRVLLTAEYRWRPSRFLDLALFSDTGQVASSMDQVALRRLRTSYGIGARFHAPAATALRAEIARSEEGFRFILGGGPVF